MGQKIEQRSATRTVIRRETSQDKIQQFVTTNWKRLILIEYNLC